VQESSRLLLLIGLSACAPAPTKEQESSSPIYKKLCQGAAEIDSMIGRSDCVYMYLMLVCETVW